MAYTLRDEIRLHNQAKELRAIAGEYRTVMEELHGCCDILSQWDSNAGEKWRELCQLIADEGACNEKELNSIATGIMGFTASHHHLLEKPIEWITGKID